jgi:hypothetical protein
MVTASLACARSSTRAALANLLSKVTYLSGRGALVSQPQSTKTTRPYEPGIFGQPLRQRTCVNIAALCSLFFSAGSLA